MRDVLKKIGSFKRIASYAAKNWLEDLEAETVFCNCVNLREACIFEALDSSGRVWWNAIPQIQTLGYDAVKEVFWKGGAQPTYYSPHLTLALKKGYNEEQKV